MERGAGTIALMSVVVRGVSTGLLSIDTRPPKRPLSSTGFLRSTGEFSYELNSDDLALASLQVWLYVELLLSERVGASFARRELTVSRNCSS